MSTHKRTGDTASQLRDFISSKISKMADTKVLEEPTITTSEGTLKPDPVVMNQGRVHVVDVTVRHEDVGYLQNGYNDKITKYAPLLQFLAEEHQMNIGMVLPIVVGTRGAIPNSTVSCLEDLGIKDSGSLTTIALLALRSSVEIYHTFLDCNRGVSGSNTTPAIPSKTIPNKT
jgi:hypothetical protein